jgi:hypothetical protein
MLIRRELELRLGVRIVVRLRDDGVCETSQSGGSYVEGIGPVILIVLVFDGIHGLEGFLKET